ncbi:MAG: alpha/beta fold hydrolase [Jatrophihabitans sp.]|uniref:alpha/beta fold hydrolase n=1 Tax=Jatrophihabitans sp. TaxID=1932789 RepID=UPI00391461F3
MLGQSHGRPVAVAVSDAQRAVRDMGRCAGFPGALRATPHARYAPARLLDVPTTVAFGRRDRVLLRRQSRRMEELPAGTHVADLPRCGHIPMGDDSAAVSAVIHLGASRSTLINS